MHWQGGSDAAIQMKKANVGDDNAYARVLARKRQRESNTIRKVNIFRLCQADS